MSLVECKQMCNTEINFFNEFLLINVTFFFLYVLGPKARPLCEGHAGRSHVLHKPCAQGLQGEVCVCL